jgi:hypothetical protein
MAREKELSTAAKVGLGLLSAVFSLGALAGIVLSVLTLNPIFLLLTAICLPAAISCGVASSGSSSNQNNEENQKPFGPAVNPNLNPNTKGHNVHFQSSSSAASRVVKEHNTPEQNETQAAKAAEAARAKAAEDAIGVGGATVAPRHGLGAQKPPSRGDILGAGIFAGMADDEKWRAAAEETPYVDLSMS